MGEFPSLCKAMYVGVDGESGNLVDLAHDHACSFVSDSGQAFKFFESVGHLAFEFFAKDPRKGVNVFCLGGSKPTGLDVVKDSGRANFEHFLRSRGLMK